MLLGTHSLYTVIVGASTRKGHYLGRQMDRQSSALSVHSKTWQRAPGNSVLNSRPVWYQPHCIGDWRQARQLKPWRAHGRGVCGDRRGVHRKRRGRRIKAGCDREGEKLGRGGALRRRPVLSRGHMVSSLSARADQMCLCRHVCMCVVGAGHWGSEQSPTSPIARSKC